MVQLRDDVVGVDAAKFSPTKVFEASGHLATPRIPLVNASFVTSDTIIEIGWMISGVSGLG